LPLLIAAGAVVIGTIFFFVGRRDLQSGLKTARRDPKEAQETKRRKLGRAGKLLYPGSFF